MRILFMGDSITDAGRNAENGSLISIGQGYALLIDAAFSYNFPGKYEFINTGISGHRIVDIYQRIKCDFWNLKPDIFSLLVGVNDVCHEKHENGVEADRFEKVYRMVIEDSLKTLPNLKMILMEPFILEGKSTKDNIDYLKTEVANRGNIVKKLADEYNQVFVPLQNKFDEMAAVCGPEYWIGDGTHPTPAGHQLIANEWEKAFKKHFI